MYIVYRLTCTNTQKSYIGYSKNSLEHRWKEHLKWVKRGRLGKLSNAIRKYGAEAFSREVIAQTKYKAEALQLEIKAIAQYGTRGIGYNTTIGGDGGSTTLGPRSKEWSRHISEALKGKPKSSEHRANLCGPRPSITGKNNPFYGKTHNSETRKKIGQRPYAHGRDHYLHGKPTANSFKSGFNHPRSTPVTLAGIKYGSIALAAEALKVPRSTLQFWLKAGKPIPPVPNS